MSEDYIAGGLSKPDWIKDSDSGELLPIEKDAEYREVMTAFYGSECKHDNLEPMRVTIADGRMQVMNCCTVCGERVGGAMSQKDRGWVESLPALPADLTESHNAQRHRKKHELLLALARKQFVDRGRFTQAYRAYLTSPAWHLRRSKVLARCKSICEGCGAKEATEVHHLSYRHFMDEFLFELVGLCHDCHERWHRNRNEADSEDEGEWESQDKLA